MAIIVGMSVYYIPKLHSMLLGKWAMRKRAKLTQEVREIIEDSFVSGLSEAINSKRISIDDARILYAKLAHLGFWGVQPRKFVPKKTALDLAVLKEELKAKRAARVNNGESSVDKLLAKMAVELS
jgi:hypothetical protein